jgi:hypothetical protein
VVGGAPLCAIILLIVQSRDVRQRAEHASDDPCNSLHMHPYSMLDGLIRFPLSRHCAALLRHIATRSDVRTLIALAGNWLCPASPGPSPPAKST